MKSMPVLRLRCRHAAMTVVFAAVGGLAVTSVAAADDPGTLSIVAGQPALGSGPFVPGPGLDSQFTKPKQLAVDDQGNVYIADQYNGQVEKLTPSGTLSLVAGNGSYGPPTPGPATSSAMGAPEGVAVNRTGDVFIADPDESVVDEVTPSGTLSVVAGIPGSPGLPTLGPGTSSELNGPRGLALDAAGDLYIADDEGNLVEKLTPGGELSIVAGTGQQGLPTPGPATSSELDEPIAVAVSRDGDLYVADGGNSDVEKVTPSGTLSVVAGVPGAAGVPTPGSALSSDLTWPTGLAFNASGNLLIADFANDALMQVTPSGQLSIIAGQVGHTGPPSPGSPTDSDLREPFGVTVAPDDTIYVDSNDAYLARIAPAAPIQSAAPTITGTPAVKQLLVASTGTWSNTPTSFTYQWQDCTAAGASCVDIAGATSSSYDVTLTDAGDTIRVVVSASNGGGTLSAISAVTMAVPTGSTATTTTTGSTATTAPTTTATDSAADAVSLSSGVLHAGLQATATGRVSVPLACPQVVAGVCVASGTLTISVNPDASDRADVLTAHAARQDSVIARFAGVQIQSGQQKLVATNLSPQTITYLRAHDIYRVRVTLHLSTRLTDGQSVVSTQHVWLYVPGVTGCHAATGTVDMAGVGRLRLGMTRARSHQVASYKPTGNGFEHYCFAGGKIRVAYGSRALAKADHVRRGRVVIALTANHHYAIHGVRTRTTVKTARRRLRLGRPIVIGKNAWYFIPARRVTYVVKTQKGAVCEIGVATRRAAKTRAQGRYLLRHLK